MTSSCVNHSSLHGNLIILHPFILSSLYPFISSSLHPLYPSSLYIYTLYTSLHPFISKLHIHIYPSSLNIQISFIPSYTHILHMHLSFIPLYTYILHPFIYTYPSYLNIQISFIPLYTHILHLQISFILASLASCIYLSCNVYCLGKKILSSDFFNFLIFATGSRGPFIFQTMKSMLHQILLSLTY